jgi:hypothetical protein
MAEPLDPIIQGLLARLPGSAEVWPVEERKLWMQLLEGSFKLIYKDAPMTGERMSAVAREKNEATS